MANKEWDEATPISNSEWDSAVPLTQDISQPQKMSLIDKIAERYSKVPIAGNQPLALPRMGMRAAGQTIGAVGDAVGSAVDASGLMPWIGKNMPSPVRQIGGALAAPVKQVMQSKPVQSMVSAYDKLDPELKTDIESAANALSVLPIGKGGQMLGQGAKAVAKSEGAKIVGDLGRITTDALAKATKYEANTNLRPVVKKAFEKAGVKPGRNIKSEIFYDRAATATEDIVRYAPEKISTAERPLEAAADGLYNAEKQIFKEGDALVKAAGKEGLPLANRNLKIKEILSPESKYATVLAREPALKKELDLMLKSKSSTAEQLQNEIKNANGKAKNKQLTTTANEIHADIQDALRKDLETGLQSLDLEGHSDLWKRYGALKDVQKQIESLAVKAYGRKNVSYLDILSTAGVLVGTMTRSPLGMLASTIIPGVLHGSKYITSQERILKNMFKAVEKKVSRKELADRIRSHYFKNKLVPPPAPINQ
jgi:hypothetical protein